MRTLPWWCAAMIAWVIAIANIDRLSESLELRGVSYALIGAALCFIVVPRLRQLSTLWILALAFPLVFALELLVAGTLDAARVPHVLLDFAILAVTLFLASRLGRRLAGVEAALDELALGSARNEDFARGQAEMFREVRRARRYERPLSMLAVSGAAGQAPASLSRLLAELRRECLERYASARLAGLLAEESDGAAVVAERGDHFLVLLPEATRQDAARMAERLKRMASERWKLSLQFGISSFPNPELTFDKLIEAAETELRAHEDPPAEPEEEGAVGEVATRVLSPPQRLGS